MSACCVWNSSVDKLPYVYRNIIIYVICYMMFLVTSSANILHIRVLFNVHMVHQFPPTFCLLWHMGLIHSSNHLLPVNASTHPSIHTSYPPTFWLCNVTLARWHNNFTNTVTLDHFTSLSQTSCSTTCSRYRTTLYINLASQSQ